MIQQGFEGKCVKEDSTLVTTWLEFIFFASLSFQFVRVVVSFFIAIALASVVQSALCGGFDRSLVLCECVCV